MKKMTSNDLKVRLLHYWRFRRKFSYISTESFCNSCVADILVSNGKEIIECEVKISKSDFVADFKKIKHARYKKSKTYIPNRLFYCVPSELINFAKEKLKDSIYGLIEVLDTPLNEYNISHCKIVKRANIIKKDICPLLLNSLTKRMSSELANLYIKNNLKT